MLPQLSSAELERELHDSLCAMHDGLLEPFLPLLAYPYGGYSESIAEKACQLGDSCALTTEAGSNSNSTDFFRLRRSVVRRFDNIEVFASRVSGLVGWLRIGRDYLQRLSLPLMRAWNSEFL